MHLALGSLVMPADPVEIPRANTLRDLWVNFLLKTTLLIPFETLIGLFPNVLPPTSHRLPPRDGGEKCDFSSCTLPGWDTGALLTTLIFP